MKTNNMRLAQIRYFEEERNAVEILPIAAYVFLIHVGDKYYNLLNPAVEVPVYERVPYSNTTSAGEDYGSMIRLVEGEVKDGVCYVIDNVSVKGMFGKDEVELNEVEKYVMNSDLFFADRYALYRDKSSFFDRLKNSKKIAEDAKTLDEFNCLLFERDKGDAYRLRQR